MRGDRLGRGGHCGGLNVQKEKKEDKKTNVFNIGRGRVGYGERDR